MPEGVILLVEGKRAGPHSFGAALEKAGYDYYICKTGAAAAASLEENQPALIIFDASSMRSSGARTCRKLRRLRPSASIIHIRAQDEEEDPGAEADVYLELPFTHRKILNRVKHLLPADEATEEIVRLGLITLYKNKRTVDVDGRGEERLTPKLLALLEEFLRHPNEVISRKQLMQNVWETDYIGDTRTLDVHIRWIREIIESDPGHPVFLQTVRGKGYILTMAR